MPTFELEKQHWKAGNRYVAGLDEAGRGCLAGPVVAAAVILPPDASLEGLDDSKKLSAVKRDALFPLVCQQAVAVGIGACSPSEIDQMNILHASLEAMRRAVFDLAVASDALLVDGNKMIANAPCQQEAVVKGDSKSLSIAAASIVAKVTRDRLMVELDADFPVYGWATHKGYPTTAHYSALAQYGASPHHRRTFKLFR